MHRRSNWPPGAALLAVAVLLTACGQAYGADSPVTNARVAPIAGSSLKRITLSGRAAQRIGVITARLAPVPASPASGAAAHAVIPMAAVLYDKDGVSWTYTSPEPLTYVRARVVIGTVDGDTGELLSGPPAGTAVVTVGEDELLGVEDGVDGE